MKICYIATVGVKVNEAHTCRWLKYFVDKGHDVHLISDFEPLNNDNIVGATLHVLKNIYFPGRFLTHALNFLPRLARLMNIIKKIKPDVIHAHAIGDAAFLGALSRFHPFVVTPWGSDVIIEPEKSIIFKWMVRYVLKRADLITFDGEHMSEAMIGLGAAPEKINIIYFGVDVRRFSPECRDLKLRSEIGVNDFPMVISTRKLARLYDIETLINAVPVVLKEVSDARFVFVGQGPQADELKELAESLGIMESTKFAGWVSDDDMLRYLRMADIYVSTSLSDAGLAASTAEAMACGLPAIVTDFGDNGKWVVDGINGFTFPAKDSQTLASKIIYLLKNEDKRKKFGELSRQMIEERNNWGREMAKMEKLYEGLIERFNR